jgi:VanZ family protein
MSRIKWILLVGYVLLIFGLSTLPGLRTPGVGFQYKDKLAHTIEYGVLAVLAVRAFGRSIGPSKLATIVFFIALGATVGAIDEMIQSHTPGRDMDVFDWVADVVGMAVLSGLLVARAPRPQDANRQNGGRTR